MGLLLGSFLNVIILRLKSGEKIALGRSHCPHCGQTLAAYELVPLLSFILQKGRCRHCQKKISWQYPLVEFFTGGLFVLITYTLVGGLNPLDAFYSYKIDLWWLRDLFFVSVLIVIFVYDLKYYLILDKVTLPAIVIAWLFNWWWGFSFWGILFAVLLGFGFFAIQFFLSRGRWLGGGDLRLGALMGAMLADWRLMIVALFLAYVIGAVASLFLLALKKKKLKSEVPFGVFLAIAAFIALGWGNEIVLWYQNLL